ncbi:tRNA-Thr(GGU) m(6)t(6)A37 methyltransferase TsaA [Rhodopseudomonas julia]|uniref:tRNA-Thr(GGU) m(6)t(6)A37 methyltransferase TsaA n=1 Tax=Rhodopseudomonas julia TaxID=200617 RepID=A0ABU0C0Z4_9BRAD|nr:tRNA (N6-threonylcarbamoyladenosine(37)-N6)-methyltransferase TrmO [Rhodopseudomonas julia]MDQ0324196.1 tRNA-Thr(GGU) m(6)t(6)A37 methyltransferase TsaA [Rhodopseudomonas julia]
MSGRDVADERERAVAAPPPADAGLVFIGLARTPWKSRMDCPRMGRPDGPLCRLEIFEPWTEALRTIALYERLEVLYWLHRSRRDLVLQSPRGGGEARGTFALRSPVRPNPIGSSIVRLIAVEEGALLVRGMDCLDETPLIDIKPDRCLYKPAGPPHPGDLQMESDATGRPVF